MSECPCHRQSLDLGLTLIFARWLIAVIPHELTIHNATTICYECKEFKATRFPNGTVACATDEPTMLVPLNQLYPCTKCSDSSTVSGMQCAWHCTQDDNCTNYNYREDLGRCEIFHYTPSKVSFVPRCYHFQTRNLNSYKTPELFPVCKDNSTTAEEFPNTTASVFHDQYVQLTCNMIYTSNLAPIVQWIDYNGQTVNNATVTEEDSQVISSILIPGYFPSIKSFTCTVADMYFPFSYYNCTTRNIAVSEFIYSLNWLRTMFKLLQVL